MGEPCCSSKKYMPLQKRETVSFLYKKTTMNMIPKSRGDVGCCRDFSDEWSVLVSAPRAAGIVPDNYDDVDLHREILKMYRLQTGTLWPVPMQRRKIKTFSAVFNTAKSHNAAI